MGLCVRPSMNLTRPVTERRVALGAPHLIAALGLVDVDGTLGTGTRFLHDHFDRIDHLLVALVIFFLLNETLLADVLLASATDPLARVHEAFTFLEWTWAIVDHLGGCPSPSVPPILDGMGSENARRDCFSSHQSSVQDQARGAPSSSISIILPM